MMSTNGTTETINNKSDDSGSPGSLTGNELKFVEGVVNSLIRSRSEMWKAAFGDTRRNIDTECGYDLSPTVQTYAALYDRGSIPARIIEVLPRESFKVQPLVFESDAGDTPTLFEQTWDKLGNQIKQEVSYFARESGSLIWDYMLRADIMSGLGRYGIILLGVDDPNDGDLRKSLEFNPSADTPTRKLVYLRVFPEHLAQITSYETDIGNPRYGHPTEYLLTLNDPREYSTGVGAPMTSLNVHWTRVIHIADGIGTGEVYGTPRMQQVLNHVRDLIKIYGASAEGYWKSAIITMFAETHPQLGGDVDIDEKKLKEMFENIFNGLQRYGVLEGMSMKSIAPAVVDPTPHINVHTEAICVRLGCPVPVFKGFEVGDLASSENQKQWNDRVAARQTMHVTPRVICPFIDRLINIGILPIPGDGYVVEWPDLNAATNAEKATISMTWTQAMAAYASSGLNQLITWRDFLIFVVGMKDEDADLIQQNAVDALGMDGDTTGSPMFQNPTALAQFIALFTAAKAGTITEQQLEQALITFFHVTEGEAKTIIADGIQVTQPDPTTLPHGAKTGTDPNLPGPIIKLPKPLPGTKKPTANASPQEIDDGVIDNANCGIGGSGFEKGNKCASSKGGSMTPEAAAKRFVEINNETIKLINSEFKKVGAKKMPGDFTSKMNEENIKEITKVLTTTKFKSFGVPMPMVHPDRFDKSIPLKERQKLSNELTKKVKKIVDEANKKIRTETGLEGEAAFN